MMGKPSLSKLETLPSLNVHLLERRITCMTVQTIVEAIHTACVEGGKITVAHYNVHSFNLSMQLPWFYNFLQSAEIAHCDSVGILKAIRCMGKNLPIQYRASYTLLMPKLLEHCDRHGLSIFLLGSKPQHLEAALERLRRQYPNICVTGHHGYFAIEDPQQSEAVIQQIKLAKPQILVVGMGMPIQENWIRLYRHRLDVNAIMASGATIDRIAGAISDCPAFLSDMGLEWFYRLCREPRRLAARYLIGNPAFVLHLALAKFHTLPLKVEMMQPIGSSSPEAKERSGDYFKAKRLGEHLVEAGLLTQDHIATALAEQQVTGVRLGEILVRKGWIKQQTIDYLIDNAIAPNRAMSNFSKKKMALSQK